jgi:protein phosphatase
MTEDSQSDTVEEMPVLRAAGRAVVPVVVDVDGRTHPGKVRPANEDHFHIVQFGRFLRTVASSVPAGEVAEEVDRTGYGFAIADGVGGRAAGEEAARLAISLLIECCLHTPDWILGLEDDHLGRLMDRFAGRFRTVSDAVRTLAEGRPDSRGMGTTLSVAVNLGEELLVAHVGDSRVYLFRRQHLFRLTRDHTTSRLVPDPTGAGAARFRRVLTRAVGLTEGECEADLYHYRLEDGDRVLLCTDGLTDMVGEDSIAVELDRAPTAAAATQRLIDLALDRGGRDNVTAIVAGFRFPDGPAARPTG